MKKKHIIWQERDKIKGQALSLPSIAKEHLGNYITEAEDVPKTTGLASWSPREFGFATPAAPWMLAKPSGSLSSLGVNSCNSGKTFLAAGIWQGEESVPKHFAICFSIW